jgi:N-acetylmuramoyl-L-alanine amidase
MVELGGEPVAARATSIGIGILCAALMSVALASARGAVAGPTDSFPVATAARVGGDDNQTRMVVDFSHKIDLRAFTLADPYRVVIDLPQVTFQLGGKAGESGRGLIKAFRFGLVMQGGSRMVIDLTGPARIEKVFALEAADGQPARLVLELARVDRATFLRNLAIDNRSARHEPSRKADQETTSAIVDPRPLIVIDPGHGGIDNGTKGPGGESEKQIVLDFALLLRDQLEKLGKYRVAMTRTDDSFVPLGERVRLARSRNAALFISIHADALARGREAQGATVYTLSETASDAEAAHLAESENKADIIAGIDLRSEPDDVADILIDLAQRETKTFSTQLARNLVTELKAVARLHKQPLKSAGFKVLRAPDVPSVLVELGFVSNREDLRQLTSAAWRQRAADAIVQGVGTFFAARPAGAGLAAAPSERPMAHGNVPR